MSLKPNPPKDARRRRPPSGQSRTWSAVESGTTMVVGYLSAVVFYQIVWPLFGYDVHLGESAAVALLMFPVNYIRQYAVRRGFNWLEQRRNGASPGDDHDPVADVSSPYE